MNTRWTYRSTKRSFDITAAAVGLIVLSPLFTTCAVAVRMTSEGPAIFRQSRVGRGGQHFELLKFRSMRVAETGPSVTAAGDSRITSVGKVLRRFKFDELPQLINVLAGDMSLVGPRPEMARYVALFPDDYARILQVQPGITDFAAIEYRHEELILAHSRDTERAYIEEVLPAKIELYFRYLDQMSFRTDLSILFRTLWTVMA